MGCENVIGTLDKQVGWSGSASTWLCTDGCATIDTICGTDCLQHLQIMAVISKNSERSFYLWQQRGNCSKGATVNGISLKFVKFVCSTKAHLFRTFWMPSITLTKNSSYQASKYYSASDSICQFIITFTLGANLHSVCWQQVSTFKAALKKKSGVIRSREINRGLWKRWTISSRTRSCKVVLLTYKVTNINTSTVYKNIIHVVLCFTRKGRSEKMKAVWNMVWSSNSPLFYLLFIYYYNKSTIY